jgi:two-component system, OmpR family, heavy metal sensor histidine kinase CusS
LKPLPIRLRLSLWYFAVFSCVGIILCFVTWFLLQRALKTVALYEMGERIDDVRNILSAQTPDATLDTLRRQFSDYTTRDDGKWLQVLDQDGNWLFRSQRIQAIQSTLPLLQQSPNQNKIMEFKYSTPNHRGRSGLALTRTISVYGRLYTVRTGFSQRTSLALSHMFARDLILLAPGLLLLAAIPGYWMSRKALSPIAELAQRARQFGTESLDVRLPISETRDEIHYLSETLNKMLDRIESGVRSIQDFTANAAHELRTPIALIRAEVEVALFSPRSNTEYRESCANVQKETVRMTGLIENLLMLARADAGVEPLRFEIVDAAQLARQVGNKWNASMSKTDLEFRTEIDNSPMSVLCDSLSIQRLLNILLENARRYTPAGGLVTLRATAENGSVLLEVCDTGIGIPEECVSRIFERFYQVDQVRSRELGGSGLGLAIAKWIADQHKAIFTVESHIGVGSRFAARIDGTATANVDRHAELTTVSI